MVTQQEANEKAKQCVLKYDIKGAKAIAQEAVDAKLDLVDLINNGFTAGINEVGELFAAKKLYLPHIMSAANALNAGMEIITPTSAGHPPAPSESSSSAPSRETSTPSERISAPSC